MYSYLLFDKNNIHEDTMFLFSYLKFAERVAFSPYIGYIYVIEENHGGLSAKQPDAKRLLTSHESIKQALDEICLTFGFSKEEMRSHYNWIAWHMVRAVKLCYRTKHHRSYRIEILQSLCKGFIKQYYQCNSQLDQLVKTIICKYSASISDSILILLYSMKRQN